MDKKAFYHMTYGLFLLTVQEDGRDNGCIINTAIQVANDPTRVAVAVIRGNRTCEMLMNTGVFTISSLSEKAEFPLFQRFGMQSGRDVDKFADFPAVARGENGLYYLTEGANMYLSAKGVEQMDLGSHILFIGEVTHAVRLSEEASCTYSYYQSSIKPRPQAAAKKQWVCSVCGYVYEGEEVPEDFVCPLCKHGKEDFVLVENGEKPAAEKRWVCSVCGYVHQGEEPPEICPVCKVPREKFVAAE